MGNSEINPIRRSPNALHHSCPSPHNTTVNKADILKAKVSDLDLQESPYYTQVAKKYHLNHMYCRKYILFCSMTTQDDTATGSRRLGEVVLD
jgi:hypothetical protein